MEKRNTIRTKEIISIVSDATGLRQADVRKVVGSFVETIGDILCLNECARVDGLGTFITYERPTTIARHLKTGEPFSIGPHWVVRFTVSKPLRRKVKEAERQYKESNAEAEGQAAPQEI